MGMPARTIRLRLTALYASVFFITGAGLLTLGYLLVSDTLHRRPLQQALIRRGLATATSDEFGFAPNSAGARLIGALRRQIDASTLHTLLWEYIAALCVVTAIAAIAGWLLAGRALAPLRAISATARRVSSENLGERIALAGPLDELRELADTFDEMLGRLDGAFASQRRFVANASHELRTPLSIIRAEVDVSLSDPTADVDDLRAMGARVGDAIDRCERLLAGLLLLARSEATAGSREPVDIAAIAADCLTDLRGLAQRAQIRLEDDLEPAWTLADPSLIERMVANLLENALHHNVAGGYVSVLTRSEGSRSVLVIGNGGARIAPEEVAELTQPFRRLDRTVPGFGLGLSIVRAVAEAYRGTLALSAPETGGLQARVELPTAPARIGAVAVPGPAVAVPAVAVPAVAVPAVAVPAVAVPAAAGPAAAGPSALSADPQARLTLS
jgi:hypothetical protein